MISMDSSSGRYKEEDLLESGLSLGRLEARKPEEVYKTQKTPVFELYNKAKAEFAELEAQLMRSSDETDIHTYLQPVPEKLTSSEEKNKPWSPPKSQSKPWSPPTSDSKHWSPPKSESKPWSMEFSMSEFNESKPKPKAWEVDL